MYHSFLIHSSADGHLGCFHVLAIISTPGPVSTQGAERDGRASSASRHDEQVVFCRNILWVDSVRNLSKEVTVITPAIYQAAALRRALY